MRKMSGIVDMRPCELAHIVCRLGRGQFSDMGSDRLTGILKKVRKCPATPICLRANTGALFAFQNPGHDENSSDHSLVNIKRDLDILQRMGLVPGATRPAIDLFRRLLEQVPSLEGICGYGSGGEGIWNVSANSDCADYARARAKGIDAIIPGRSDKDMATTKDKTARGLYSVDVLHIRPQHLMCMTCFDGNKDDVAPIAEDNLYEAIDVMRKNPNIPVRLVKGCCMICPPCSAFFPETNACIASYSMALRDEKKDLDVLHAMGLEYGDTMPAHKLLRLLFSSIHSTTQICGYGDGDTTSPEWRVCGGKSGNAGYLKARAAGLRVPGATP